MLFPDYYLENPKTGQIRTLRTKDYVLAGILASLYVFWLTDLKTFARALFTNLGFIALAVAGVFSASLLPGVYALVAAITIPIALALWQSREMIKHIVVFHAVKGWAVTRA